MKRSGKSSEGTRVRFIMLEAESDSGDLTQIAAAIQNALRPKAGSETKVVYLEDRSGPTAEPLQDSFVQAEEDVPQEPPQRRQRSSQKRSFPTPKVSDVNWDVSPRIEEFVRDHPPKTVADQYLAALAWFKEAGDKEAATVDDVYTIFRKVGWPTNIRDFSQPLRDLKGRQWVTGGTKEGFSINHLGLDRVKKFGKSK